ncbi:MAG: hypothetical protein VXZ53_04465, partial [Planctomycetota bacterium]|nr:hypothetical protein [Planctomycetota bacterium]
MNSGHAEDAILIAQKTSGPLTYKLVDFEFDDEPLPRKGLMHSASDTHGFQSIPEPGLLRRLLGREAINRMNERRPMDTPEAQEFAGDWLQRLQQAEARYRFQNDVPPEDFVILLTTRGNVENFFVIPGLNGTR